MKKFSLIFLTILLSVLISETVYCENKTTKTNQTTQPFIISIVPDSLFYQYNYSQTVFLSVPIMGTVLKDPTAKALANLQKTIIETCRANKVDGFLLNQMIYSKQGDEGELIVYGTLLKKKKIVQNNTKKQNNK